MPGSAAARALTTRQNSGTIRRENAWLPTYSCALSVAAAKIEDVRNSPAGIFGGNCQSGRAYNTSAGLGKPRPVAFVQVRTLNAGLASINKVAGAVGIGETS